MSRIGATGMGKSIGLTAKAVNEIWDQMGLIMKDKFGDWILTEFGKQLGGEYSKRTNYPVPTFEISVIKPMMIKFLGSKK